MDSDGPRRKIIDGNYRKKITNELGYDCPEIVQVRCKEKTLCRIRQRVKDSTFPSSSVAS